MHPAPIAFVTGANGFLGSALVRELLADDWHVRAMLRPGANDLVLRELYASPGTHAAVEPIECDLLDPEGYRPALAGCTALFHTAASYTHDPARLAGMEAVNVEGTRLLLAAALAAGVERIVHTSTIGTVGQPADAGLASEETAFNLPNPSAYVRSKLAGERIALEMAESGAPIVIVHPAAMLGPGDWRPSASGRRFLDAIQAILNNKALRYPAGGINWAPVADVAQGMILAAQHGRRGRRYLLGHRQGNLDREAFLHLVAQATGAEGRWVHRGQVAGGRSQAADGRARPSSRWQAFWRHLPPLATRHSPSATRHSPPATDGPARSASDGPHCLTCDPTRAIVELGMPQTSLLAAATAEYAWYRQHGYL